LNSAVARALFYSTKFPEAYSNSKRHKNKVFVALKIGGYRRWHFSHTH
jgi:hypothetical protein